MYLTKNRRKFMRDPSLASAFCQAPFFSSYDEGKRSLRLLSAITNAMSPDMTVITVNGTVTSNHLSRAKPEYTAFPSGEFWYFTISVLKNVF
jgi:hypothetical protein